MQLPLPLDGGPPIHRRLLLDANEEEETLRLGLV